MADKKENEDLAKGVNALSKGASKAAEVANNMPTKKEQQDLYNRVLKYVYSGGRPEYADYTEQPKTYSGVDRDKDIWDGTGLGRFESFVDRNGNLTRDVSKVSKVSLDKKTGNVKITAPKNYLESEYYQNEIKPILKSYSQAYKINPDYKFPSSTSTDGDDEESEEHDIEWYINNFNEELPSQVLAETYRQNMSKEIGTELSYDNLRTMNTVAVTYQDSTGTEHKVSDSDRQVIPNIAEANFLKEAVGDAWDPETNTVDYRTLMDEGWNREKHSDEEIVKLEEAVNAYFKNGDFSDAELYSQMYAFRNFMNQQAPHTGFWRGVLDWGTNILYGTLTGAAGFWVGALDVAEGLFNRAGETSSELKASLERGQWVDLDTPTTGEMNFWRDTVKPEYERLVSNHNMKDQMLNPNVSGAFTVTNAVTPFLIQWAAGAGLTKLATETVVSGVATARTVYLTDKARQAANSLEKTAYSIYAGTNLMMDALPTAKAAEVTIGALSNLTKVTQALNTGAALGGMATTMINGAKVLTWAVEITSDAVIDCALGRPEVVRAILDGDDEEGKYMLLEEIGANAVFWGAARGVGKVGKAVKGTKAGRVANAVSSTWANRISARVGKTTDKLKNFVFGDDWKDNLINKRDLFAREGSRKAARKTEKLTNKINTLANRETVRKQKEILGRMSIFDDSDDVMGSVKKIEKQILNVKKAELLWDDSNLRRATNQMFETLVNSDFDPEFKGSFDAYMSQLKEVIRAENAAGFATDPALRKTLSGVGDKGIRVLDQRTINYFNAKIHLSYDIEYGEVALGELEKMVKDFTDVASPELVEATDALIDRYREVYYNLHRLGMDPDMELNFYNSNEIIELNNAKGASGEGFKFGENGRLYGKTMRTADIDEYYAPVSRGVAKNRSTVLSQSMDTANGSGDFVDPTYVLCADLTEKSRIAVTQGNEKILSTLPGVNNEIAVGAGATEQVRIYKGTDGLESSVKSQVKAHAENIELSDVIDDSFEKGLPGNGNRINRTFSHEKDFVDNIDNIYDDYLENLRKTKGGKNLKNRLSAHADNISGKEFDYIGLSALSGEQGKILDDIEEKAKESYLKRLKSIDGMTDKKAEKLSSMLASEVRDAFVNRLDGRISDLATELIENGSTIVDTNKLYTSISEAAEAIEGAKAAKNVVKLYDVQGREIFVEMDPLLADIFNNRPIPTDMSGFQKINNLWNRTFRLGTTGANLKSFMAQNVKDFGNAWVAGGADATIKEITSHLTNELGDEIVSQIQQFEPRIYSQLQRKAAETGDDLANLAVQRELSIGRAASPSATETEAFNFMLENRGARFGGAEDYYRKGGWKKIDSKIDEVMEKLEAPNAAREKYLRNLTYANGFSNAIDSGQTIKDARYSARFLMNNATTNFGREMYHLNNLRSSVPYFGAAVNGTKSFWRLWSLDPVGVTGRILGGIALPVVYLTGQSLSTAENRRIWKNIPEYQKDGNIVFISNGNIISIPIPEELGGFINPVRQFVEHLHGVDPKSFQELMLNDLIGLQPFELDGFVMYDRNRLLADPTIWDRIGAMTSKFSAQVMPPMVKSAVIWLTQKDPYTGKTIPRGRVYIDPDTGEEMVMDYAAGSFATMIANLWGDVLSPQMAQVLLNNIIGNAGTDLLNGLWGDGQKLFSGKIDELLAEPELAKNISEQISAPFTINKYSLANSQWNQVVGMLNLKKTELLADKGYIEAINGMKNAKNDDEYNKYKTIKQNYIDEYYQEVKTVTDRLIDQYPQAFDRSKFATVISLLNMDTGEYGKITGTYGENAYNDYLQDQLKISGKNVAIATMAELGFKSSNDASVFGYYGTDKETGKAVLYYNDPISILNMKQAENSASKIHLANIRKIVNENNLWDEHESIRNQVNAIYDKEKLSNSDYDQIDAIYVNWNAKVMSKLAPYVERMTPEAAINNSDVMDYLDGLFELPGDYKKDKYGRYVTNKTLGKGSAKDAYIENYIKEIFKINDTKYAGGRNYSGRK